MQTHGGSAAEDAITAPEREILVRVRVDWNDNGAYDHELSDLSRWVRSVSIDRSLEGDLPDEIRLVQGAAAAKADITLSGNYGQQSLTAVFSPYNPSSPFYTQKVVGVEITIEYGLETEIGGTVWYPQFVGDIRELTPSRGSGVTHLNAFDRVEKLRTSVHLPPWAYSWYWFVNYDTQWSQVLLSDWLIDHCLRVSDVSTTPYRPAKPEEVAWAGQFGDPSEGPQLYVTGHRGHTPTVGWSRGSTLGAYVRDVDLDTHPVYLNEGQVHPDLPSGEGNPYGFNGSGDYADYPLNIATHDYLAKDQSFQSAEGVHLSGLTLLMGGDHGDYPRTSPETAIVTTYLDQGIILNLVCDSGSIWVEAAVNGSSAQTGSSLSLPVSDVVEIRGMWDLQDLSSPRVFLRVGDSDTGWEALSTISGTADRTRGQIEINRRFGLQDLCVAYRPGSVGDPSEDMGYREATYPAVLDEGNLQLRHLPEVSSSSAWDVIKNVAQAEFGSVLWDEEGVFRFWSYDTMLSKQNTIVRTLGLDDISDLSITHSLDSVVNIYESQVLEQKAVSGQIFEASREDQFHVWAGTTSTFILDTQSGLAPEYVYTDFVVADSNWDDSVSEGFVICYQDVSGWISFTNTSTFDIYLRLNESGQQVMDIENRGANSIRLRTEAGQPALRIQGTYLTQVERLNSSVQNYESSNEYGPRSHGLQSQWHHRYGGIDDLLVELAQRTDTPLPQTDNIVIRGDPRLQLGDTIEIRDSEGLGDFVQLQILGITRDYTRRDGLVDTLTVELIKPTSDWVLGDETFSVLGESTIL